MTKNTKTLLTIGGIAVVGYILWKRGVFGGKKSFAGFTASDDFLNFRGGTTSRTRVGLPTCGQGCLQSSQGSQYGTCAAASDYTSSDGSIRIRRGDTIGCNIGEYSNCGAGGLCTA